MPEYLKSIITLLIGASLPLIGQLTIEKFKRKGDRMKFSFEKVISVGEEFYRYSGLTILRFEATLDILNNIHTYGSIEALKIFADAEANIVELCKNIASSTITITTANIYYDVSNVHVASNWITQLNKAMADFHEIEKYDNYLNNQKRFEALENLKGKILELVSAINRDRNTIEVKIKSLINSETIS